MTRPLLIVKVGDALEEAKRRRGDYDRWFREGLGLDAAQVEVFDPRASAAAPPSPREVRAVVVTGSSCMVSDHAPWSVATGAWLREVVAAGTPLLGVCYGHQLLAEAFGGRVERNPNGREIGTIEVSLTEAARGDALFHDLGPTFVAQATHREAVLALPDGAVRLGGNALDPNQAFRLGDRAFGVQFHPEFDDDVIRDYLAARADACREEGLDPDALLAAVRPSDHGRLLLARFRALSDELQAPRDG
jgi:GMP synthase (glutamine-hydrolysing)